MADQPRPPSVKVAIVNQSPGLVVDVIGCNFVMHNPVSASTFSSATPQLRLVRISATASDARTRQVQGVAHDTSQTLSDVECLALPRVTTGSTMRTMPKCTADYLGLAGATTLVMNAGAQVVGARGRARYGSADLAGGGAGRSIVLRAGEGVAVMLHADGINARALPLGGATVEVTVRELSTSCVTTFVACRCDVSLASGSQASPRALLSVFVPGGSSEVIEILSVRVVSEEDEYPIVTTSQLNLVTLARMPWTAVEDADPSLLDHTSQVVGHAGDAVSQWGVRCVRGDVPLRYSDGDFVRTDTGSVVSGDEASLNSSYLHAPLPGQVARRAVQQGVSTSTAAIHIPLTNPAWWRGPTSRNPITVRAGEAFVATLSPDRLLGAAAALSGAYLVMDVELTFQVRRPAGAPFGRAA